MARWKLVVMASMLLFFQVLLVLMSLDYAKEVNFDWPMMTLLRVAGFSTLTFTGFLLFYAWVRKKDGEPEDLEIPEASAFIHDPFFEWCEKNMPLLRQYYGCHLAISPTQGIMAVGKTDEEFAQALDALEDLPEDMVLTHYNAIFFNTPTVLH